MNYGIKSIVAIVLSMIAITILSCCGTETVEAESGTCGDGVTWELDGEGNLVISGEGEISQYAFANENIRRNIRTVTINSGVTAVGFAAFDCSYSMLSVTIPDSVTRIDTAAFQRCGLLTTINVDDSNPNYCSVDGVLFNKAKTELIQYPIGKTDTSYSIPDSVTSIGNGAFRQAPLTSITIPDSVTHIGGYAFSECASLTSITIPDSVEYINYYAFSECASLTSITIPDSVTSIDNSVFDSCCSLTTINVDDSNPNYCSVDGVLFNKAKTELIQYPIGKTDTSYSIPDSVIHFGLGAFKGCTSLTSVTIPDSVTSTGASTFEGCTSLTSVTIPDSVIYIDGSTFYGCTSLTSVTIPNSVTTIGIEAFQGCTSLTSVTIPDSVTSIGIRAFYGCTSLTSVTIPDSVTSIGEGAFDFCDSLVFSININVINSDCGDASPNIISNVHFNSVITVRDSTISVDNVTITLTPKPDSQGYVYSLQSISIPDGYVVRDNVSIDVIFTKTVRQYTIQFINGGIVEHSETLDYGSTVNYSIDPLKESTKNFEYRFMYWMDNENQVQYKKGMIVEKDCTFTAFFEQKINDYDIVDNEAYLECLESDVVRIAITDKMVVKLKNSNLQKFTLVCREYKMVFDAKVLDFDIDYQQFDAYSFGIDAKVYPYSYILSLSSVIPSDTMKKYLDYPLLYAGVTGPTAEGKTTVTVNWSIVPFLKDLNFRILCSDNSITSESEFYYADYTRDENGFTFTFTGCLAVAILDYGGTTEDAFEIIAAEGSKEVEIEVDNIIVNENTNTVTVGADNGWSVSIPTSSIEGKEGTLKAKVDTVSADAVTKSSDVKDKLRNGTVYSIEVSVGSDALSSFPTECRIILPYKLDQNRSASNLKVYNIVDGALAEEFQCEYEDGFVSFGTTHLSYYAIVYEEPSSEFPIMYVAIGGVAAVALIGGAIFLLRRRH